MTEDEQAVDKTPSQMTEAELIDAIAAALGDDAGPVFAALTDRVNAGLTTERMALMIAWTDILAGRGPDLVAAASRDPAQRRIEFTIAMEVNTRLRVLRGLGWDTDLARRRLRASVAAILAKHFPTVKQQEIAKQVMTYVRFEGKAVQVNTAQMIAPFWRRSS